MKRGQQITKLVDEIAVFLKKRRLTEDGDSGLRSLLQRNSDLLRSFPEHSEYLEENFADAFASLSNEIIYDVVAFAGVGRRAYNVCQNLLKTSGRWSEFAQKTVTKSVVSLEAHPGLEAHFASTSLTHIAVLSNYTRIEKTISFDEAKDEFISRATIQQNSDFKSLRAVAANLYGFIQLNNVDDMPSDVLKRMGTRFTSVTCLHSTENHIKPAMIDFLKRQLRSKCLTKLHCAAQGFKDGELDDLLVDFVKRPSFRLLRLEAPRNHGNSCYFLPFRLFEEAQRSYEASKHLFTGSRRICGCVSSQTMNKVEELFKEPHGIVDRPNIRKTHYSASHCSVELEFQGSGVVQDEDDEIEDVDVDYSSS